MYVYRLVRAGTSKYIKSPTCKCTGLSSTGAPTGTCRSANARNQEPTQVRVEQLSKSDNKIDFVHHAKLCTRVSSVIGSCIKAQNWVR